MKKPEYFSALGDYTGISPLSQAVLAIDSKEWERFKYRQKTIVGHKMTRTIPLIFDYQTKSKFLTHPNYEAFLPHLEGLSSHLRAMSFPYDIKRANIVKLLSKSDISPHVDKGDFLEKTRRVHVVITTNDECTFVVDGQSLHMSEGQVWEINNTGKIHSVHNRGETDRIHLIVDVG